MDLTNRFKNWLLETFICNLFGHDSGHSITDVGKAFTCQRCTYKGKAIKWPTAPPYKEVILKPQAYIDLDLKELNQLSGIIDTSTVNVGTKGHIDHAEFTPMNITERLKEALEFYSKRSSYSPSWLATNELHVMEDKGKVARDVLELARMEESRPDGLVYRALTPGEVIEAGDELYNTRGSGEQVEVWGLVPDIIIGNVVSSHPYYRELYRRQVRSAKQ